MRALPLGIAAAAVAPLLGGCAATHSGALEVLNPAQAYGKSVAVADDFYRENEAIEGRLASDLRAALTKRGFNVTDKTAKAEVIILPTLGRMKERSAPEASPVEPVAAEDAAATPVAEPVVAARPAQPRAFTRLSGGDSLLIRNDPLGRRVVPSAHAPASIQQAGLLLTAYRVKDYEDYGIGRQSLPPVWRVYVSQPAVQMKWKSVAVPLINAAARAAAPLGKAQNEEGRVKKENAAVEKPESRVTGGESREKEKKGSVFRLFIRSAEQTE